MNHTIAEIAAAIGAQAHGKTDVRVACVSEPADAGPDALALAIKPEFADQLRAGRARAAMLWDGADWQSFGIDAAITVPRPRFALSGLSALMDPGQGFGTGVHPSAVIDPEAVLAPDVSVGPGSVIMAGAQIGPGSVIGPLCFIGMNVRIGAQAQLREHVSIGRDVTIGARFIAQPGARIGGDGFSYVTPEPSGVEQARASLGKDSAEAGQSWARIHSLGSVTLGDDVEIGANASIDSGTVRDTRVGNRTKIDSLVHLGHNVEVGEDCLLCGLVGIAGSAKIGNFVVLGGQTGVSDNITIGDRVITGGATKLLSSVPAGRVMLGYPATKMDTQMETYRALRRLPRLFRDVAALKNAVFKAGSSD